MKYLFLLVLITFVSCGTIIEKIECLLNNEKIINEVTKVVESFKTNDLKEIISKAFLAYLSVKDDIKNCFSPEPNLLYFNPKDCYNRCFKEQCVQNEFKRPDCRRFCRDECFGNG